jgi:hypothetical protein
MKKPTLLILDNQMKFFGVAVLTMSAFLVATILLGDRSARRYQGMDCQHKVIWGDDSPLGLVTIGGSRMLVASVVQDVEAALDAKGFDHLPAANIAHSYYSVEKEYVLLRDLLDHRPVKTALVVIEPRGASFGRLSPDFLTIAKLSDLSTAWQASGHEAPLAVFTDIWTSVKDHMKNWKFAHEPDGKSTAQDCAPLDFRLDLVGLASAQQKFDEKAGQFLEWNLESKEEQAVVSWAKESKRLTDAHGTELFFILMTGTGEFLPDPQLATRFKEQTGADLITFSPEMHQKLSASGRRDHNHLNADGRAIFLPWLINQIAQKCKNPKGCF